MNFLILFLVKLKEFWYNRINTPKASMVLLIKDNKILSVSRKNNISEKGIIGGKVDKGETFKHAAIRETKEETNLDIFNLMPVFIHKDKSFTAIVYIAEYMGDIKQTSEKETGVVEWVSFDEIKRGPFGAYNTLLEQRLNKLNILI